MVRGEGQERCAMPMYREAVKDGQRAWTEGPEETMRGHGRSSWCTEEQEYTGLEMASAKSSEKTMASQVGCSGAGNANDLKASRFGGGRTRISSGFGGLASKPQAVVRRPIGVGFDRFGPQNRGGDMPCGACRRV
ncbi:unnamed protein product [Urochloa humidicola]